MPHWRPERGWEFVFHKFSPQSQRSSCDFESHLAIHTWPELGYAVDVFTCGETVNP